MCQFYSAVLINKGKKLLWDADIDSHSEILEKFGIKDETSSPKFVRLELTPPNGDVFNHDFSQWNFKIDQDFKPDWYDDDVAKMMMIKGIKELVKERFVISRKVDEITSGRWWVGKDAVIKIACGNAVIQHACGNAVIQRAYENAVIERVCGNAVIEYACGNAVIQHAYGNAVIQHACENAVIQHACGNAVIIRPYDKKIIYANPDWKAEVFKK